jgi:2-dehydro-3-deoxygluconokinase
MDRGHSAISQLKASDIDWAALFTDIKPRWFHVGGVMAGLSEHSPEVVEAAMIAAKNVGAIVSYDLNYRHSLWQSRGGKPAAQRVNSALIAHADVLFGVEKIARSVDCLDYDIFSNALLKMKDCYPNLKSIVTTMRIVKDASRNLWGGMCLHEGEITQGKNSYDLPILDRVGGGDGFAAGFIYGMLNGLGSQQSMDIAVAHGALVMSTAGDNSMSSLDEVLALAGGSDASAKR